MAEQESTEPVVTLPAQTQTLESVKGGDLQNAIPAQDASWSGAPWPERVEATKASANDDWKAGHVAGSAPNAVDQAPATEKNAMWNAPSNANEEPTDRSEGKQTQGTDWTESSSGGVSSWTNSTTTAPPGFDSAQGAKSRSARRRADQDAPIVVGPGSSLPSTGRTGLQFGSLSLAGDDSFHSERETDQPNVMQQAHESTAATHTSKQEPHATSTSPQQGKGHFGSADFGSHPGYPNAYSQSAAQPLHQYNISGTPQDAYAPQYGLGQSGQDSYHSRETPSAFNMPPPQQPHQTSQQYSYPHGSEQQTQHHGSYQTSAASNHQPEWNPYGDNHRVCSIYL